MQTAKPKKIRSKSKTACKTVKFDIFHTLVIKILINAIQVTRENTEVIRDQWKRIIAAQIKERQDKPEPKGEKPKTTSDTKFENPLVFLTKIRKPKAKKRKIRIPK